MNGRGKGQRADKGHLDQAETNLGPAAPPCGTLLACFSLHCTQMKRTKESSVLPLEAVEWRKKGKEGGGGGGRGRRREGREGRAGGGGGGERWGREKEEEEPEEGEEQEKGV